MLSDGKDKSAVINIYSVYSVNFQRISKQYTRIWVLFITYTLKWQVYVVVFPE